MNRIIASTCLTVFAACFASGQSAAPQPAFEVASIKLSDLAGGGMQIGVSPGGVFTAKNATLNALIQQAYGVRDFQISGGSGWLDTEQFDIIAKGQVGLSDDEVRRMTNEQRKHLEEQFSLEVRSLLESRFQLKVHHDTKELPILVLSVEKGGTKLRPAADGGDTGGGLTMRRGETGKLEVTGTRVPVASLVKLLSKQVGRTVVDRTGLTGDYDFKMTFSPDIVQQSPDPGDGSRSHPPADTDGPSIFTALQVQLGLRLEAQKGPVDVIVIDSVQKPSAN